MSETSLLQFATFQNTPQSLGLLSDFVSTHPPFDRFEFRLMTQTLKFQLENQCHIVAGLDDQIAGYLGWIPTTIEVAEAWMENAGPLIANLEFRQAVIPTVLVTIEPRIMLPLIKHAKTINPGIPVYWKRQFSDERLEVKRAVRKKS
jgi:hypothetical protein